MARPEKVAVVDEIAEKIKRTQSLFLTDFTGLDVESINELRRLLRENSVEYLVVKNTLASLAVDKAGYEGLKPYLIGPTAMAFGFQDPALPAKLLSRFAQKTGKPSVKAILFEGQLFEQEAMGRLKNLPSREELLTQMVSGMKAPITHTVMVLAGLLRNFVSLIEAISRKKGESEKVVFEEKAEEVKEEAQKPAVEVKPEPAETKGVDEKPSEEKSAEEKTDSDKAKPAESREQSEDQPEETESDNEKQQEN
jgi:large subunit ribosomal protein L10